MTIFPEFMFLLLISFQEAFLKDSEKKKDKWGRVPKGLKLKPKAMPSIFPWDTDIIREKTAGKTKDQVDKEIDEAMDLQNELERDANSSGTGLHPGNSRFVSDGPIPGNAFQYLLKELITCCQFIFQVLSLSGIHFLVCPVTKISI